MQLAVENVYIHNTVARPIHGQCNLHVTKEGVDTLLSNQQVCFLAIILCTRKQKKKKSQMEFG